MGVDQKKGAGAVVKKVDKDKRKAGSMNSTGKKPLKKIDSANEKLVETIAERAGVSKRHARQLAFDADQRIAKALGVDVVDVQRARERGPSPSPRAEDEASDEERRDWAAEDKHDLKKEGGWEP